MSRVVVPAVVGALLCALPAAAGDVAVEVAPEHIVLGEDSSADVTITVGGQGEIGEVRLFTNVGRALDVEPAGQRRFRARFEAPKQFYPHVAVVVAVADVDGAPRVGFTTLPLWGQGALEASGAPGSDVVALIGGRRYGPAKAGDDGIARIAIQVAPGETEAKAGNETLPLGLVDFPRVVGVSLERTVAAHPELEVSGELRFFVTGPDGRPLDAPELRLDVAGRGTGRVDAPVALAPGVLAARVHVPAGASGPVEVRWRLSGSAASKGSLVVDVRQAPPVATSLPGYGEADDGAVTDVKLEAPKSLVLGREASAPVVVTLPPGAKASDVRVYTNVGRVSSLEPAGGDRYRATFYAPPGEDAQAALLAAVVDVGGTPHLGLGRILLYGQEKVRVRTKRGARVTVEVAGERFGPVKASRRGVADVPVVVPPGVTAATFEDKALPLAQRPFPRLLVVPLASHVVADGQREVPVRVYALTEAGTPLADAAVRLDVDQGELSPLEPAGKGVLRARYRAAGEPGVARFVAALDGDRSRTTTLRLPLRSRASAALVTVSPGRGAGVDDGGASGDAVSAAVPPARKPALVLVGAHAGFSSNFIALYAPLAAVDVTLQGSGIADGALAQLEVGTLYQPGESRVTSGPLEGRSYARHLVAVPLVATLGWRWRLGDASVIASAGGTADYAYSVVGDASEHFLSFGAVGQVAGAYQLGPGELLVKARYTYGGLEGGFGAGALLCGYAFEVF